MKNTWIKLDKSTIPLYRLGQPGLNIYAMPEHWIEFCPVPGKPHYYYDRYPMCTSRRHNRIVDPKYRQRITPCFANDPRRHRS